MQPDPALPRTRLSGLRPPHPTPHAERQFRGTLVSTHTPRPVGLWVAVFSVGAATLVATLLPLVAWRVKGSLGIACFLVGCCAGLVCLYAATKLRDRRRADAALEGDWLRQVHAPTDMGALDD